MTSSINTLVTSFAICAAVLCPKMAQAEGFHFGGGSGNKGNSKSSFKIKFNGNGSDQNKLKKSDSSFKKYLNIYTGNHKVNHKDKRCRIR